MRFLCKKYLLTTFLLLYTLFTYAQENRLNTTYNHAPIKEALKQVESTFHVFLSYSEKSVDNKFVTATLKNADLHTALTQILSGYSLSYEIVDEEFIVIKKPQFPKKKINGVVIDEEGNPMPYASIIMGNKHASTKNDGSFQLSITGNNQESLRFNYLGYNSVGLAFADLPLDTTVVIQLSRDVEELPELVYEKQLNEVATINQSESQGKNVKNSGIGNLPISSTENIYYAVKLLPSVSTTGFSSAMQVRGGETDQNLTLIDNYPMYQLDHYFGLENVINPDITSSATLYAGGYDCLYGARVSSILDIGLKDPPLNYMEGNVGVSLLGYKGYLSLPIVRGKLAVYGTFRQYHGAVEKYLYDRAAETEIDNSDDAPDNIYQQTITPDINYHDANAKIVYQLNDFNKLSLSYLNSQDNYSTSYNLVPKNPPTNPSRPNAPAQRPSPTNSDDRSWTNNAFSLNWKGEFEKWSSHVYATYSQNDRTSYKVYHLKDSSSRRPIRKTQASNQNVQDFSLHSDQSIYFGKNSLDVGAIYTNYNVFKESQPSSFFLNEVDSLSQSNTLGVYGQYNLTLGRLRLTAGSRVWYYQPTQKPYIAPRIQGNLPIDQKGKFNVKFSAGRYYQFIRELSDELTYDSYWIISDEVNVPVITSNHYIGGFTASLNRHSFDIEGYLKQSTGEMSDLIFRNPVYFHKYVGDGNSYGLDFIYEFNHKRWYNYVSYGYNQYHKQYTPKETESKQTHILQLASMYQRKRWKVGLTWVLKDVSYDFNNLVDIPTIPDNPRENAPSNTLNAPTPYDVPLYHRLDFSSQYNFKLGRRVKGEVVLTIYDLYNQKNTEERQVTSVGNNSYEYILTDVSQLGILPNLSFNVIF
ncbi:TonB-dependent receptor plug domain-containing protein [Flammeovirga sp. SubArs3]|uniref:carboxypeptidase-like regulatory domain-containing protein n=1 Tax=Flammeovirga sp. SubArs3 TaxID=2995316 RepID=UPI00248BA204|nr:TonB-dependent receptor plug domain-containing protein [Flammeovirga sp. SubArs3]